MLLLNFVQERSGGQYFTPIAFLSTHHVLLFIQHRFVTCKHDRTARAKSLPTLKKKKKRIICVFPTASLIFILKFIMVAQVFFGIIVFKNFYRLYKHLFSSCSFNSEQRG